MAHRRYYSVRAAKHEKAARHSRSANDKAGHHEVARGYRKLARGGGGASYFSAFGRSHKTGGKKRGRKRGRKHARRNSRGRFVKRGR